MQEVLAALLSAIEQEEPVALATVVETRGSSPAQPGFKLLVYGDGRQVGNAGGGALEQHIRQTAIQAMADGKPKLVHFSLREQGPNAVGALCGGEATVFVEPYLPKPTLLIVGGGHIGQPLAQMASLLGYRVQVVDIRPERATVPRLDPSAITSRTYVVIVTGDHVTDQEALRQVIETPAAYIGVIGSRRKIAFIFRNLQEQGIEQEKLDRVRAPIGLDLGGQQPAEIALAILAEVEMVRHGGSGQPRSWRPNRQEEAQMAGEEKDATLPDPYR